LKKDEIVDKRVLKLEQKVLHFNYLIKAAFYELRSIDREPSLGENEKPQKVWVDEFKKEDEFKARVWDNFTKVRHGDPKDKFHEIPVLKKTIVTVKKPTLHYHWEVQKINGTSGYVPCCILEPLK